MIQAARLAFGFSGIYDQDEAERIIEVKGETIDGTTGEILERKPKELPDYTDAQLNENIAAWQAAINAGKTSPGKILAMIGTKYKLSEAQADAIRAIYPVKKEEPAIDAEFVAAMEKGEQQ